MNALSFDWLTARGGAMKASPVGGRWLVYLDGTPQFALTPKPMNGRFTCAVMQTNNGQRIDTPTALYATEQDAIKGGMEQLRTVLGW